MAEFDFDLQAFLDSMVETLEKLSDGAVDPGELDFVENLTAQVEEFAEAVADERLGDSLENPDVQSALSLASTILRLVIDRLFD